jgi:putative ABC transport system permease protein
MSALAAALRIAKRDALRHKARSGLIVAMVAIPVLGLTAADVLARTMQLNTGQRLTREIGHADLAIQKAGDVHVTQGTDPADGYGFSGDKVTANNSPAASAQRAQAFAILGARPAGTTVLDTSGVVVANGLQIQTDLTLINLNDPLTAGIATVISGKAPTAPTDVAITRPLAKSPAKFSPRSANSERSPAWYATRTHLAMMWSTRRRSRRATRDTRCSWRRRRTP